jgi:hypothetical protein
MSDQYSDDFSRGSDRILADVQKDIYIDEQVEIEDDRDLDQDVNKIDNNAKRMKKPQNYNQTEQNVFVSKNPFIFQEPDRYTHWKTIDKVDVRNVIRGDIQQLNTVMNELAFSNFNDPAFVKPTKEGQSALQVMQFSLQYFMFTQSEMVKRIGTLHSYIQNGKEQLSEIKKVEKKQKERIKKQKRVDRKLNEQAMHYEFLIRKYRPDLDPEKLEEIHKDINM